MSAGGRRCPKCGAFYVFTATSDPHTCKEDDLMREDNRRRLEDWLGGTTTQLSIR